MGRQHPITGIVHLAVALPWTLTDAGPVRAAGASLESFLVIVRAVRAWGAPRVVTASTIGVHGFASEGALTEEVPIPFGRSHAIPTFEEITSSSPATSPT
ncbi:NAD(P)-dependent oxidoreductase [Kineococcus indalonis]|uniref:NAD(P)-dependent oxidoreductase n=1 Tax=Kineococcus indalonis TaxID=2696566 RepID=UPI00196ACEDC|nr:NAD(P)-dependent oxidoreductase [Kineococcus indalonis]